MKKNKKGKPIALIVLLAILVAGGAGLLIWRPWSPYVVSEVVLRGVEVFSGDTDPQEPIEFYRIKYDAEGRLIHEEAGVSNDRETREWSYDADGFETHYEVTDSTYKNISDSKYRNLGSAKIFESGKVQTYENGKLESQWETQREFDKHGVLTKSTDVSTYSDGEKVVEMTTYMKDDDFDNNRTLIGYDDDMEMVAVVTLYDNNAISTYEGYDDGELQYIRYFYENGMFRTLESYDPEARVDNAIYDEKGRTVKSTDYWTDMTAEYNYDGTIKSIVVKDDIDDISYELEPVEGSTKEKRGRLQSQTFEYNEPGGGGLTVVAEYEWQRKSKLPGA